MKVAASLAVASLALILLQIGGQGTRAFHPLREFNDPYVPVERNWVWPDLEPGGDGSLDYWTCESYVPSFWPVGIEDEWDADMSAWSFNPVLDCEAQVVLFWEEANECEIPQAVACTILTYNSNPHANHYDIVRARMYFDTNGFAPYETWQPDFKISISAHEWGHVMGLADDSGVSCTSSSIMIQGDRAKNDAGDPPCTTGPTGTDLTSVRYAVYRLCDFAVPGDWDGNGSDTVGIWRPSDWTWHLRNQNSTG